MVKAYHLPISYGTKLSKPMKPNIESESQKEILYHKPKKTVRFKEPFQSCQYCNELQKTIEFERKLILILTGGLLLKIILDSVITRTK